MSPLHLEPSDEGDAIGLCMNGRRHDYDICAAKEATLTQVDQRIHDRDLNVPPGKRLQDALPAISRKHEETRSPFSLRLTRCERRPWWQWGAVARSRERSRQCGDVEDLTETDWAC